MMDATDCFGNDIDEVDMIARRCAQMYCYEVEKYRNPRGGQFQAGIYPVSANVLFGKDVEHFLMDVLLRNLLLMDVPKSW